MNTPISDFIKKYAESGAVRLHMPGHKGVSELEAHDITEINGADVLYSSSGIIRQSEDNAASLFGAKRTVYSAEGSSLSIRAALYLAVVHAKERGISPVIAAGRNAHKAFLSGAALLDLRIKWLYGESDRGIISCTLTAEEVEKAFASGDLPAALYITSPDYLGNICDIGEISKVCKKYGVLLIVDNAHGAYLGFLEESAHPISLGADICCDSAHKTLPVLTGGGYLHISEAASDMILSMCDQAMSLFASTSPSYLILESLDSANAYLAGEYREELSRLCLRIEKLKESLSDKGYKLIGEEPIKLTIAPKPYGYTGEELADCLEKAGVICEFADKDFCVMMFTPRTSEKDIDKVERILSLLAKKTPISEEAPRLASPKIVMSHREAVMCPSKLIPVENSLGCVLAQATVACPPAVPIAVSGELIDESTIAAFRYYGVKTVRVVKGSS